MEGPKIVAFPSNSENEKRQASLRERLEASEESKVTEMSSMLDAVKVIGIRRIIAEESSSPIGQLRFKGAALIEARESVRKLSVPEAIKEVNTTTDKMVRLDPVRHYALLEFIEERFPTTQDEE